VTSMEINITLLYEKYNCCQFDIVQHLQLTIIGKVEVGQWAKVGRGLTCGHACCECGLRVGLQAKGVWQRGVALT